MTLNSTYTTQIIQIGKPKNQYAQKISEIDKLAIKRIRELEKEIFEKWGIKIAAGHELEFVLNSVTNQKDFFINEFKNTLNNSNLIHKIYNETSFNQLEVVLSSVLNNIKTSYENKDPKF